MRVGVDNYFDKEVDVFTPLGKSLFMDPDSSAMLPRIKLLQVQRIEDRWEVIVAGRNRMIGVVTLSSDFEVIKVERRQQ